MFLPSLCLNLLEYGRCAQDMASLVGKSANAVWTIPSGDLRGPQVFDLRKAERIRAGSGKENGRPCCPLRNLCRIGPAEKWFCRHPVRLALQITLEKELRVI
jgi:hypothetical protein